MAGNDTSVFTSLCHVNDIEQNSGCHFFDVTGYDKFMSVKFSFKGI